MLETDDIQGLVVRGYGPLSEAKFLLLSVNEPEGARAYLRRLCGRVNTAKVSPEIHAIQVAFTATGLAALGVPESARSSFSREFIEGMDDDVRAESLGDRARTEPTALTWSEHTIHVLLMVYAKDHRTLQQVLDEELAHLRGGAFKILEKNTRTLDKNREHFGWRDGLSMPNLLGVPKERPRKKQQESWTGPLEAGEIVLGYPNEYSSLDADTYSESPTADLADDPAGHLPPTTDKQHKDLGRNGTYLVYRELTQKVHAMWDYLAKQSKEPGNTAVDRAIALGAKMVGRWPNGAPLVESPGRDDTERDDNTFTYLDGDAVGLACPVGSHIRRANPRDALGAGRDDEASVTMVRKHQMVRRGRPFGEPVSATLKPEEILAAGDDKKQRGLHFICLVGNISRQFEFVQRNWIQSANFGGLYKDGDPLIARRRTDANANDDFTCPAVPVRRKYKGLPEFTKLVGGGYFFLPGVAALKFIARHP